MFGVFLTLKIFSENETLLVLAVDQSLINEKTYIFCHNFLIVSKEEKIRSFPSIYSCSLKKKIEKFLFFSSKKSLFRLFQYLNPNQAILFIKNNDKINSKKFCKY